MEMKRELDLSNLKISVDCSKCEQCCKFNFNIGEKFAYEELPLSGFPRELCDVILDKVGEEYVIPENCQHYDGKCAIFGKEERPIFCNLFPVMIAMNSRGRVNVYVDKNCPEWNNVQNKFNKQDFSNDFFQNVIEAIENKVLPLVFKKDYEELGYKLKKLI
jgi:Fe-S-cluster containining protein